MKEAPKDVEKEEHKNTEQKETSKNADKKEAPTDFEKEDYKNAEKKDEEERKKPHQYCCPWVLLYLFCIMDLPNMVIDPNRSHGLKPVCVQL